MTRKLQGQNYGCVLRHFRRLLRQTRQSRFIINRSSAGDVLSHFNIGTMGLVEANKNRIVMLIDFMWIRLKDNKPIQFDEGATPNAPLDIAALFR